MKLKTTVKIVARSKNYSGNELSWSYNDVKTIKRNKKLLTGRGIEIEREGHKFVTMYWCDIEKLVVTYRMGE